jgi:ADP-ribose pyrophosphatase YjhB (NUDIX family)
VTSADELRMLADELRVLATVGIRWSPEDPYNKDRYERVRRVAAELFSIADTRSADEIERTVFSEITHIAPIPCGDGAVFDDEGRILLIRRADDGLWAMPGGGFEMGETPAEAVAREVREEAGVLVEVEDLVGVYDSRLCGTRSALQLYMFVFLCRPVGVCEATTPYEVTDIGWFARDELPPLSAGHGVRVPGAFDFVAGRVPTYFDPP